MAGKFESQQNKGFIWDLLYNENAFDQISPEKKNEVKDIFDECFSTIEKTIPGDSLIDKNKMALSHMIDKLHKIKSNTIEESYNVSALMPNSSKTTEFEKNVEKHKNDLQKQMNPPLPVKPTFSEGIDQPLGKEIDGMLNNMIKNRNLDIKTITDTWVDPNTTSSKSLKKKLQIKDTVSLHENSIHIISAPTSTKNTPSDIPIQRRNIANMRSGGVLPDIQKELDTIKQRLVCLEKNTVLSLKKISPYI